MSETASASASGVLEAEGNEIEDEPDADTDTDESLAENIEGLDADALDAVGVELATALLAGAVGVAAWQLPDGWLVVSTFALGGASVLFAENQRVRAVGSLILAGTVAPLVGSTAFAVMLAGVVAAAVGAVYHHGLVDLEEMI